MPSPKVSVVMTAFNSSAYLSEAVESILNQTFSDFEFIVIDDCSTDDTWEILSSYAARDERISLVRNEENLGTAKSSNKGLCLAKGEYIARFDSDDIALPNRLQEQVKYMESNPSVALITTPVEYINIKGEGIGYYFPPAESILLSWRHIFCSPLRHPTAFWRRQLVESAVGQYNPEFRYTLDYDFFVRVSEALKVETLPSILLKMRQNPKSITFSKGNVQDEFAARVTYRQIDRILWRYPLAEEEKFELRALLRRYSPIQREQFAALAKSQVERALRNYLNLFENFYSSQEDAMSPRDSGFLHKEIEDNIPKLLSHCIKQKWDKLGWEFLVEYLKKYPSRFAAVTKTIIFYFSYCKLQEIGFKEGLQKFRTVYGKYLSRRMLAQSKETI
ncbi:glycosyltransferase [Pseudanabaena sp. FACHB-2040]|uniref:glycosyltransferase family 2 protein n=1 Tax=Pseudanabaena sp. FACHB-2040 TaxID=2692859 RepID=UPI00168426B1|nr:glycosyltransferase [Pseudanabaena sp. FACHB-2040]MBD2260573.1 glycosyltransferase [Pseudanabaena sp. FACHB-2040]